MESMKHLQVGGSKIGVVMQTMVDYKPDDTKVDVKGVLGPVAELREDYQHHGFGKGDKLVAGINLPRGMETEIGNKLLLELTGGALGKFHRYLEIPLNGRFLRRRKVRTLHDALELISHTDPGGNASNEARNIAHWMETGVGPEELHLYSSTDPLFDGWYVSLPREIRERVHCTMLVQRDGDDEIQLPPRQGLHLPYSEKGEKSISDPATSTIPYLRGRFRELLQHDHVIVSEGLGRSVLGTRLTGRKNFLQKINPSSAFRGDCAVDSYELTTVGGKSPIVTMNDDEFDYYVRCISGRIAGEDPDKLDPIPFISPFADDGTLEQKRADIANRGLCEYFRHIRPARSTRLHFPLSVSLGGGGGYHIAEREGRLFVVFSSTPHTHGARALLRIAGNPQGVSTRIRKVMGAGDAVGALLSLANIWDVEAFIAQFASQNKISLLKERHKIAAGALFVSILSRYVGGVPL